jgi:serine protease AprX
MRGSHVAFAAPGVGLTVAGARDNLTRVDGTSFAAPIVSSIAACMLEANPALTPQQVKRILIDTAERVPGIEVERQGWGVVVPRRAVEVASNGHS